MRKYFLYELKKHIWTLVVLTAVCAIPYMVDLASLKMFYDYNSDGYKFRRLNTPHLEFVFIELLILLLVVPTIVYSFKMSKRGVDGYYALPLKKEKLYFVATIVGLILVLVPFTVSFWGGFLTLLVRPENPYQMQYYVSAYFGGLCFAIFLYGVNAFVFTRANRVIDGVIFMAAYAFVGFLFCACLEYAFDVAFYSWRIESSFMFGGGMFEFSSEMTSYIMDKNTNMDDADWWFGTAIAAGAICYTLLFLLVRYERAENAEQNSDSWFGYKTLIPVYIALCLGSGAGEELYGLVMVLVAGIVATIVYKRKFSLKLADWTPLGIGLIVGLVLAAMGG